MKKILLTVMAIFAFGLSQNTQAQCNYVPTVYPADLILCPNATDTLWTQVYDSYQWYKDDSLIQGATNRYYVVDQYWDAASNFKVVTSLNGCIDTSESVLVDGWVFSSPFVIHEGDQGRIDDDGITHLCKGDTLILSMNPFPYDTNITWYNGGAVIPGENGFQLKIYESGFYSMSGSPKICPDFVAHLGVEVGVIVHEPEIPTINANGNLLSASNATAYQWFFNGSIIPNAVQQSYRATQSGVYSVSVIDVNFCNALSEPFNFTLSGMGNTNLNSFAVYPNPASNQIKIDLPLQNETYVLELRDLQGKLIVSKVISESDANLSLEDLSNGVYLLELKGQSEVFYNKLSVLK